MLLTIFLTILGLVLLIGGGDILVRGGLGLANRLGVSPALIGLVVMGFGTSAPELFIGVEANIGGKDAIAVGNIIGSNIMNLLLVLGLGAAIMPLSGAVHSVMRDNGLMVVSTFVLAGFVYLGALNPWAGGIMLAGLIGYFFYALRFDQDGEDEEDTEAPSTLLISVLFAIIGLVGLLGGAHMVVLYGAELARAVGVSEGIIGLTLVAFGTSLPELVATLSAILKKQSDMAIANILGSNGFNSLAIPGVASLFGVLEMDAQFLHRDVPWMIAATLFVGAVLWFKKGQLPRWAGFIMLVVFIGYLAVIGQSVFAKTELTVKDGWVRHQAGSMTAAYITIENKGSSPARLIEVRADFAKKTELHETIMENQIMKMRELKDGISIDSGQTIHLRPREKHIMLMELQRPIEEGERVDLKLIFEPEHIIEVTLPVSKTAP